MDLQSLSGTSNSMATPAAARPRQATRAEPAPEPVRDPEQVARAVAALNRAMAAASRDIEFSPDPASGHTVVRVMDRQTQQVIRQMPSEEALAISRAIEQWQGMVLRQKA